MTNVTQRTSGELVELNLVEYGRYVAEDRALANIYDGLKPVQRRVLWTVWERLKLRPGSTSKRSARVTGEATGVFHPHGDVSTYGALVTMTWQRYPLIEGYGNFGNPITDMPPAAARYTGVLAPKIMPEMFSDQVVAPMEPNYSGEFEEPSLIPTKLPVLLMNGSEGIAVGVAANIPPHNLKELVAALKQALKNPEARLVHKKLQGPDYPEGGVLVSSPAEVEGLYREGQGSLTYRCKYRLDKVTNGYTLTVISGCPRWSVPKFIDKCQQLAADNKLGWVENQSGEQVKVVCYSRDRAKLIEYVAPLLTRRIRYNWIGLDSKKRLVSFNLVQYLTMWLDFRRHFVKRHLKHQIKVTQSQLEAEEAKLAAAENLDATMKALRAKDPAAALRKALKLNARQVKILLRASIRTLTRRGETKQRRTTTDLKEHLDNCHKALGDIDGVIRAELEGLKPYFDVRRTEIGGFNGTGSI